MDQADHLPQRVWNQEFEIHHLSSETIRNHPGFPDARRRFLKAIIALYGEDAFLNKLLMEAARTIIFGVIIVLSASYREEDRLTWPTLSNIQRLIAPFSQSSPRKVEQVIQRLVSVGYLRQSMAPNDRRIRLLTPTSAFISHDQDWLSAFFQPLDDLFPDGEFARPLARDPAFQTAQRRASLDFMPYSALVLLNNPDILLFATRDAGFLVLAQLALDQEAGRQHSYEQLAQRFAVSRTHVRQLLEDAARLELLILTGRGGHVTAITPRGWLCLDRFIADGMSGHDLTGGLALRTLGHTRR